MLKVAEYLPFKESTLETIELQCFLLVKMRCSCFEFFLRHIVSPKRKVFFFLLVVLIVQATREGAG